MARKILIPIAVLIVLFAAWQLVTFVRMARILKTTVIENIDIHDVKDGAYEGDFRAILVSAHVKVRVKDGAVADIELLEHDHGPNPRYSGQPVLDRIIDAQSLDVDGVSGATGSSIAVRKAVEIALKKGIAKTAKRAEREQDAEAPPDTAGQRN
jgi:uncharacterized protein with FMN-binding domain